MIKLYNKGLIKPKEAFNVDKEVKLEPNSSNLFTFIEKTKNGEYCKIDNELLKYSRVEESRHEYNDEEQYFYSIT